MKSICMTLPNPAPDLVGACSLLFELGGMTVIHDAAGCMENYAVFDEPRWFGSASGTYSSGLKHMDAVLGNEERLINQLSDAALSEKPAFTAIVGSPVPYTLGMDLDGMAAEVEARTGIPSFAVPCGSFAAYDAGISDALERLIRLFCKGRGRTQRRSVNLLGCTPLDLSDAELEGICALLNAQGVFVKSVLCMGASLEDIRRAKDAEANLVISYGGIVAARRMKAAFGIPYVCGIPMNTAHAELICARLFEGEPAKSIKVNGARCLVLGEQVFVSSLAEALRMDGADAVAGVTMSMDHDELQTVPAKHLPCEQDIALALSDEIEVAVGDPLYALLMRNNKTCKYVSRPHTALSSRLYAKTAGHFEDLYKGIKERIL